MRTLFSLLTTFAWALWLGGLIALFISVQTLFHNDHDLAVKTAPQLFHAFNTYQLILGGVAIVGAIAWGKIARSGMAIGLAGVLILCTAAAVVLPVKIVPPMNALVAEGQSNTPQFRKLHGESMMVYCGEVLLLTVVGLMLPSAHKARPSEATTSSGKP